MAAAYNKKTGFLKNPDLMQSEPKIRREPRAESRDMGHPQIKKIKKLILFQLKVDSAVRSET